jgi:hypothetical protein
MSSSFEFRMSSPIVEIVIARLLRAFGYSGIGTGIHELVFRSNWPDAMA